MTISKTALMSFVCVAILMGYLPQATAGKKLTTGRIECTELDSMEWDAKSISVVKVHLDAQGNADQISIVRDVEPRMKADLDRSNSTITHEIVKQEPNEFNVTEVETIVATDKSGNSIRLNLNDHSYAGSEGSSMNISSDGKSFSTLDEGHMLQCKGDLRLDTGEGPAEAELLN